MTPSQTIDTPAYQGRATIHFSQAKHYYTVSVPSLGKSKVYQPGVTSIIKMKDKSGPLCWWTAQQCEAFGLTRLAELEAQGGALSLDFVRDILGDMKYHYRQVAQRAADIGSVVHDFLHQHLSAIAYRTPEPQRPVPDEVLTEEMCEQANNAIDAGLQFFDEHEMKPVTMEQPVWSPTHGYVGTDDFIGLVDGEMCTCDYKTSKSLYPEVWLQTAAYQAAYQEEHPSTVIKARWGINTGKDGTLYTERRASDLFEEDFEAFLALMKIWRWDRAHGIEPKSVPEIVGPLPEVDWVEELAA
jgi:hypothetical protein